MMDDDLEVRIQSSLGEELRESFHAYPQTLRQYTKALWPAMVVSLAGSTAGQWLAEVNGFSSKFETTAAAYLFGYAPAYLTYFEMHYRANRHVYTRRWSKAFREYAGTFLASDYVADLTTFSPAFVSLNLWLSRYELHPAVRNVASYGPAIMLYLCSISALHPLTRRINERLNSSIAGMYRNVASVADWLGPAAKL